MTTAHLTLVPALDCEELPRDESDTTPVPEPPLVPAYVDRETPKGPVRPADAGVEIGTYFERSWGYDQTNVDFYKVVGLTPKGVRVQEWSNATVDDNGPITHVIPGDGPARRHVWPQVEQAVLAACGKCANDGTIGGTVYASKWCEEHGPREQDAPVLTKRLTSWGGRNAVYIAVGSYNDHARPWDGKPSYATGSGWGH